MNEYVSNHVVRLVYWVCAMFSDVSSRGERTREKRQGRLTLWTLFTCELEKRRLVAPLVPHLDQVVVRAGHKVR